MQLLFSALFIALQGLIVLVLSRRLGPVPAAAVYAALAAVMALTAGALVRSSTVGRVTWRNRVAGLLLPWSMIVGGGTLRALLVKNAVAGALFGTSVVAAGALVQGDRLTAPASEPALSPGWADTAVMSVTAGSGLILLVGWLWLLRAHLARHSEPISMLMMGPGVRFALLAPPVAIAASIALRNFGYDVAAMLIVTLPLLVLLGPVALMCLVVLGHAARGKPIRWN